jgi:dimethylamine monooxygenase subunit A
VNIPFPVESTHEVRPDLKKLSLDEFSPLPIVRDSLAADYLAAKLACLSRPELNAATFFAESLAPNESLVSEAATQMGLSNDSMQLDGAALAWLNQQPAQWQAWHRMALAVQEDLILMQHNGSAFFPAWLHVCAPSGWDPGAKSGLDLAQVHAPVAENKQLLAGTKGMALAMINKGPFVRYVWTLSESNSLSQHPVIKAQASSGVSERNANALFFRCERQVTLPLPQWRCSLFLIRVFVAPLASVATSVARCQRLIASLLSMNAATLAYKGLTDLAPLAIHWLEHESKTLE